MKEQLKQQLKQQIKELREELAVIEANLAKVPEWEARRRKLRGDFGPNGLIANARRKLRNELLPIWRPVTPGYGADPSRIVAVTEKWIITRSDLDEDDKTTRYRRIDGRREFARGDSDNIDVTKVLTIWEAHLKQPAEGAK